MLGRIAHLDREAGCNPQVSDLCWACGGVQNLRKCQVFHLTTCKINFEVFVNIAGEKVEIT